MEKKYSYEKKIVIYTEIKYKRMDDYTYKYHLSFFESLIFTKHTTIYRCQVSPTAVILDYTLEMISIWDTYLFRAYF